VDLAIHQHHRRVRIDADKTLLRGTGLPITTNAFEPGYASSWHFSGAFKHRDRPQPGGEPEK
jgi:AraC-like DNA-binding protein